MKARPIFQGESADFTEDLDWATIKYTPDGKEHWVIREDGPAHGTDRATAIAVDQSGNVYVAGSQTKTNGLIELVLIKYSELDNIRVEPDNQVGPKIGWMAMTLLAMLLQFGIILVILRAILVTSIGYVQ